VFIRGSHRSRCVPPDLLTFADICLSADEELFSAVIRDIDHLFHKLLPPLSTASQSYNLWERKHNYLLRLRTGHLSDHNFIQSLLVSDHFPVFSYLNLSPSLPPPPQSYTFRRLNSIDDTSFLDDLKQSSLITNPPQLSNHFCVNTTLPFTVFSISMHPSLPNDLLATVLLIHGSPNPFVLLVAPVVKPNLPTDPHTPLQTSLSSWVFVINSTNWSLQPKELTTHSWSNPHQIVHDANGTQ